MESNRSSRFIGNAAHTVPIRFFIAILFCFWSLVLTSCELWGARVNPADSGAGNYQGYPTVSDAADVKPASTANVVTAFIPKLIALKVAGAEAYQFQIAVVTSFSAVLHTSAEIAGNEYIPISASLSSGTTYYWRVRSKKDSIWADYSTETASFSLSVPNFGTPAPANSAVTTDTTPLLDWNDVTGASGYEIQIADSSGGVTSSTAAAVTASQYQVATGLTLGTWYWRVRAKNVDNVWGAWSAVWSFTTAWTYSLTPSPADAGTTSDTTPLLDWNDAAGASGYEIQIGDSSGGVSSATATAASTSQYQYPTTLALGDTRYWRVRAKNEDNVWGAWSATWSFTTAWTYALTPLPADAGTTSDTTPLLDWTDAAGAAGYEVQIADSSGGVASAVAVVATISQYQYPTTLALGDTRYWRVRAKNADNVWAAWSATWSFTTAWMYSLTTSPTDTGTTSDTTPLLDWSDAAGAAGYEVQIADTSGAVPLTTAVSITTSQYQYPTTLALDDTRYWRVRPKNADNVWGPWSATWSFTIGVEPLLTMIPVPGGTFQMGSNTYSSEQPIHSVAVSSFRISKYEVTQVQYTTVTGNSPSYYTGDTSRPVEQVTWYDAVEFCNKLSQREGLQNVYTISSRSPASGYPITSATVSMDRAKSGYRLPTEAEWEYAARGGASSAGYTYSGSNTAGTIAWYSDNAGGTTHSVGTKAANELGIYDMSGNVWEWCWDWYGTYPSAGQTDPTGASSGSNRVLRGGGWGGSAGYIRSASRDLDDPHDGGSGVGFRVLAPSQSGL